jgi:hypothetical protein
MIVFDVLTVEELIQKATGQYEKGIRTREKVRDEST